MVLELITNSLKLRDKPYLMFFEAIILTILALFISLSIFSGSYVSISVLAFITIGALPLFNKLYSYDSYLTNYSKNFFRRHKKIIFLLFFFFLGVLFTLVASHFVLDKDVSSQVFYAQKDELGKIQDLKTSITGNIVYEDLSKPEFKSVFLLIFENNLLVLFSAIILSFFYGAGGLFLIVWNASLLSVVLINYISSMISGVVEPSIALGVKHGFLGFLGYVPHGFFEVLAYFVAGLAGAIFAKYLFKDIFTTSFKWHATRDLLYLIVFAIVCLIIGALIEASYFI